MAERQNGGKGWKAKEAKKAEEAEKAEKAEEAEKAEKDFTLRDYSLTLSRSSRCIIT